MFNPARYYRFLAKINRLHRATNGLSTLPFHRLLRESYHLLRTNLLEPEEYFRYELFDPSLAWEDKQAYLSQRAFVLLNRAMNPQKEVGLLNKLVFKIYAQRLGLPVPDMYGVFDPAFGFTAEGAPLRTVEHLRQLLSSIDDYFLLKPIGADKGMGILLGRYVDNDQVELVGEKPIPLDRLAARLTGSHFNQQAYVGDSYLIEERVRQHPFLDRYTTSCTQTLRVITFTTRHRQVEPIAAIQKIAVSGVPIDNVGQSGMAASVDEGGVMGPAYRLEKAGTTRFDRHPETGAAITGARLPNFDEAIALAVRAQAAIPQMRNLAWDIALTETGATIIEGNAYWGWEGMQRNTHRGLMRGALGEELRDLLRTNGTRLSD